MPQKPSVIVFDVNETLSDMSPMFHRFEEAGAPGWLATQWFSAVLRDGFALTAAGNNVPFKDISVGAAKVILAGRELTMNLDDAIAHIVEGFSTLTVHPDVADGIKTLQRDGFPLITLSNGPASIAQTLMKSAGLEEAFEDFLSVEDAQAWKPSPTAYGYAARHRGVAASELMLVAVHPWDIHGASQAGLQTAWVNRGGELYPSYFARPDISCRSLEELADTLAKL